MRTMRKLLLLGIVFTMLAIISGASAQGVNPGLSKANIFLQNLSQTSENADITLQYTRGEGITVSPASFSETITGLAPGGAKYLLYPNGWQEPPAETTVQDGWAGAVEVASSQPLAAIVNLFWDGNASAGTYPGVDSASHDVYLPNLLVISGRLTMVYIQNTESSQCTDVDLHYYNRDGTSVRNDLNNIIPANTQITLDLSDENPDFSATKGTGSMHIHSDSCNLAAVATIHYPAGDRGSAAYRGFTGGETTVWFPSVFRRQSGTTWQLYNATIVQNLGSTDASVTVHFIGKGSSATASVNDTIKAKASNGYNMITQGTASSNVWSTIQSLGTNWVGTIMVESTNSQPLAGVGLYFSMNNVPDVMGYESIADSTASDKLYSPAVYRKYIGATSDQWSTTLVQNLCGSAVDTDVDFYDSGGAHAAGPYDVTIPANSSVGLNLHAGVDLPDQALTDLGTSYSGGMVVSSAAGDCLIGVTNIFYESKVTPGNSRERGAAYPLFPAP
jgi:hypothetical protein